MYYTHSGVVYKFRMRWSDSLYSCMCVCYIYTERCMCVYMYTWAISGRLSIQIMAFATNNFCCVRVNMLVGSSG